MRLRPAAAARRVAPARRSDAFRPDIQALRALAVGLVVLNHLWPTRLTGGYVGVDVFFVISGFLISSHLIREIATTGRIRLTRFYARRIRRLLPAAFLVLVFVIVAAYFLIPYPRWESNAQEVLASATYWENWLLAAKSVDYSQLTAAASLTQHYWSLSVEEQFYLFWPLLLLLLFKIRLRRARIIGIAVVAAASLAFSVYFTAVAKSQAYFVTPVRVWEFAIGAAIGLGGAKFVLPRVAANLASLAGVVAIVAAALVFDDQTAFPGATALVPAVGTGLVIAAGTDPRRQWHTPLSSWTPVQFLGNISYSLYLWHWPLIVLAPFAFPGALVAGALTGQLRLGVLGASLVLAYLSKRLVEDPVRTLPTLAGSVRLTFTGMLAGMVAVAVVAGGLVWTYQRHVAQAERELAAEGGGPCHGAPAVPAGNGCPDPFGPARNVTMGPANAYWTVPKDCPRSQPYPTIDASTPIRCDYSGGAARPKVVWLVGDSHAQQWQIPVVNLARANHWQLNFGYLGGCPFAKVAPTGYDGNVIPGGNQPCVDWTARMTPLIAATHPAYVFTSFFARDEPVDNHSGRSQADQYRDGLTADWSAWTGAGARVVVLGDPPLNGDVRAVDCVALNPHHPRVCATDRTKAQPPDPLASAARQSADPNVQLIDLTDYFCDEQRCYGVVGKVAVYYDANHLNGEFSRSLEPIIADAVGVQD
ncbi:MAG TPA: acyltransferase family protein [Pseudonocardiaceae bacterium]|nr:acyltransferase family protein [Pseudonocardiaceae bacterium]